MSRHRDCHSGASHVGWPHEIGMRGRSITHSRRLTKFCTCPRHFHAESQPLPAGTGRYQESRPTVGLPWVTEPRPVRIVLLLPSKDIVLLTTVPSTRMVLPLNPTAPLGANTMPSMLTLLPLSLTASLPQLVVLSLNTARSMKYGSKSMREPFMVISSR